MPPKLKKIRRPISTLNNKDSLLVPRIRKAKVPTAVSSTLNNKDSLLVPRIRKGKVPTAVSAALQEIRADIKRSIKVEDAPQDNSNYNYKNEFSDPDDPNLSIRSIEKNKIIFNCKKCINKNYKFEKNYKKHLLLEHSTTPGSVKCRQCPVVCPNKEILHAHISKVHDRNVFYCEHCGKKFVRQAHVLRHMAQRGCDGSDVASFPCEICNATFTRKDNLIVHLRHMHIRRQFFDCKHCDGFATKNLTKLIRHWHAYHAETPNRFECYHCGKSTMSRAAMAKHLEIHGDKKYACDVCGYTTYTIEVMRRHILTHVVDKPYKCTRCSTSYIQRAQLFRHMETHCGVDSQCDVCGDEFDCKSKLMVHKRKKHEGIDNLLCPFKDCIYVKEFSSEELLVKHLRLHMQQKSKMWSCQVCEKKFTSEMNMRRHLSTHTLDRPRRCMYCVSARAYVRGQQLVRHVRKFHGDVFRTHLAHVRKVIVTNPKNERVTKSELESILNLLDAEAERILEGYGGADVLYGGMQAAADPEPEEEDSPLMSEEVLAENLGNLLEHLIDKETLQCLGWPEEPVDNILERVIEQCGATPADREMWSRVQRLRENAKHLFLYVVDDKNVAMMLGTHTIDQIVKNILNQVEGVAESAEASPAHAGEYGEPTEIEIELAVT